MKHLLLSTVLATAAFGAGTAHAACGDVTLAAFSWQSSEAMTYVDQFILNNGYGCNATTIAGDTVPTITSLIEKGQPDVVSEATPSLLGPRIDMQRCSHSIMTITPRGFKISTIASAICEVIRSCTCGRFA